VIDLIFVGAGGTCADVLAIVETINAVEPTYRCVGILDDSVALQGKSKYDAPVLGELSRCNDYLDVLFVDCLGSPRTYNRREEILKASGLASRSFASIIAPSAFVSRTCILEEGCIVYPGVVLMAGVRLGRHVTVLSNSVLNHGVAVGDFGIVTSGVNVSGDVQLGRACYIGTGASLIQNIRVGDGAMVGMGSVVLRDVRPLEKVAGVPARQLMSSLK
jgi:sugar O-acyltransferase (sialic acid O-acetyltransferase NeuD family)